MVQRAMETRTAIVIFFPVSYTHLDVYKRQALRLCGAPISFFSLFSLACAVSRRKFSPVKRIGAHTVSYTHLDVYKRQLLSSIPAVRVVFSRRAYMTFAVLLIGSRSIAAGLSLIHIFSSSLSQFVSQSVRKSISRYLKTARTAGGSRWCPAG